MRWGVFLLAVVLAGCSSGPSGGAGAGESLGEDVEVHVTDTTGAIRGVVVDEAIRPVAGAAVTLLAEPPQAANTTDGGTFSFSDLAPGTYFLQVSRLGFASVQASAEVVAGLAEPPVVRVQLARDASQMPYTAAQSKTGYILCTTSAAAVCGAPNLVSSLILCDFFQVCVGDVTPDRFGLHFYFDPNATLVQAEMVWDSTQPVSPDLELSAEDLNAGSNDTCPPASLSGAPYTEYAGGPSPVLLKTNATEIALGQVGGRCPIFYSVFSGGVGGTPGGFTVQQAFDIFTDAFYGYTPPEGWRRTVDGEPPAPPS